MKSTYQTAVDVFRPNCFSYTYLNNAGVLKLLRGDVSGARKTFQEANQADPFYEPAAHNLKLVGISPKR